LDPAITRYALSKGTGHLVEARRRFVYKILVDFGSLRLDPLWIVLVVCSLLLLALAQSYASAKQMKLNAAVMVSLAILLIGDAIVYYLFIALFRDQYPANYTFPHVSIYSYGFMLMIAFIAGTIFFVREGRKAKPPIETDTVLDLMVFIIIGSIIGARLIYVLTQWSDYSPEPKAILQITQGGLSIHGGILGAMVFGWIYMKVKGLDYWRIVDIAIPGVPLGMFLGRIGCFLNGCCYGIRCQDDFPMRVKFPDAATWTVRGMAPDLASLYDAGQAAMGQYFRHPAQLYESIGALAIFYYLLSFRKHRLFNGHVFLMFVWLYSLLRFFVEFYRFGDPTTGAGSSIVLWKFITMAQLASLILGVVAFVLMQDLKRRAMLTQMFAEGKEPPKAEAVAGKPSAADEEEEEEYEEETEEIKSEGDKVGPDEGEGTDSLKKI
jgi:phosphatidylglycerol:prolipoprotein diacylglycerol transferase